MFFNSRSTFALLVVLFGVAQPGMAVCASGQMAVGTEFLQEFTGPSGSFNVFSGFLMANNCGLISQNGLTQDEKQYCKGGYSNGASVQCDGSGNVVSATDTQGQRWNCFNTNDQSCNVGGSGGRFTVLACCNRA